MSGVEAGTALQLLRAKQNAYYIQSVQDALQAEEQRKQRLHKAATKQEAKWLEKQFIRERSADRERLRHIQEDHALLLNAKIAEWKAIGGKVNLASDEVAIQQRTERRAGQKEKPRKAKFTKESRDRLAVPRVQTANTEEEDDRPTTFNSRGGVETSQELEFYKNVYRKQDRARLSRNAPSSHATLNASLPSHDVGYRAATEEGEPAVGTARGRLTGGSYHSGRPVHDPFFRVKLEVQRLPTSQVKLATLHQPHIPQTCVHLFYSMISAGLVPQ